MNSVAKSHFNRPQQHRLLEKVFLRDQSSLFIILYTVPCGLLAYIWLWLRWKIIFKEKFRIFYNFYWWKHFFGFWRVFSGLDPFRRYNSHQSTISRRESTETGLETPFPLIIGQKAWSIFYNFIIFYLFFKLKIYFSNSNSLCQQHAQPNKTGRALSLC